MPNQPGSKTLRTSSYTIYVDLPDTDRELLLVHGYTGAYDRVSREVAGFLRSREARRAPRPLYGDWSPEPEAPGGEAVPGDAVLATLARRGYLTALAPEAEEAFFSQLVARLHERAVRRTPSYIFMPSYDCNLRCSYCFQDHMRTDCSFKHLLRTLRPAMVDRIFAAIPDLEARHGLPGGVRRRRSIGFFGGEPLLAAHRPVVELIMERALALGEADFWAVTNGTELAAYRDLLGPGKLARLQITLDGPPREHDRRRVYADGSGSFELIAENITLALELGAQVSVRLNVDRANLADLPDLADEIVARGWHRSQGFSAYTAPIRAANGQTGAETTMNSWQLDRALTELRQVHPNLALLGRPDEGVRARARRLFDGEEVLPQFRPSFCGAHDQMYIFDPFGDIYACWERTGDPDIRIGRVTPEGGVELRFDQVEAWRGRNVASNPVCRRCRYALHCGGGCAILALEARGTMHSNYCDGFASRFRAAVAEAYLEHLSGAPPAARAERVCNL